MHLLFWQTNVWCAELSGSSCRHHHQSIQQAKQTARRELCSQPPTAPPLPPCCLSLPPLCHAAFVINVLLLLCCMILMHPVKCVFLMVFALLVCFSQVLNFWYNSSTSGLHCSTLHWPCELLISTACSMATSLKALIYTLISRAFRYCMS